MITAFLLVLATAQAARPDGAFLEQAIRSLQAYIKIDTTNPPGNEADGARFLKRLLDQEEIQNEVFDLGKNRANLIARLPGDGSKKGAIILLHHIDVVPAEAKFWSVPPFSGEMKNGAINGRGAVDIKGKGITDLMTLIWFKRKKIPLKRDLVLLAVSDEENISVGSKWMIQNKADLLKGAAALIDEGKPVDQDEAGQEGDYFVSVGEKAPLWLTLIFAGPPGHGSEPIEDSAANQAIRAAAKILDFSKTIEKRPPPPALAALTRDPETKKLLHDTIAITGLKGSDKTNTISNEATIKLDCRLLPGRDREAFIAELKKAVSNDRMKVEIEESYEARFSPTDSEFTQALSRVAKKAKRKMIPTILTSSTDSSRFRAIGISSYGFEPYPLSKKIIDLAHGNNEHMPIKSFHRGMEIMIDLITELN